MFQVNNSNTKKYQNESVRFIILMQFKKIYIVLLWKKLIQTPLTKYEP